MKLKINQTSLEGLIWLKLLSDKDINDKPVMLNNLNYKVPIQITKPKMGNSTNNLLETIPAFAKYTVLY